MNKLTYTLLNKINNSPVMDEIFLEKLYRLYAHGNQLFNSKINISKKEFKKFFYIVYDILILKIKQEEFKIISEHYVKLLMADAKDGALVDINWFIDHIWYLCVGLPKNINTEQYKDCIPFIQQKLITEFNIEENLKEKISRKIYTKMMI